MTIHPHLHDLHGIKQWVLGRNRIEVDAASRFGDRGVRRYKFDGYWSGEKWVRGTRNAKHFASEADALEYLEMNVALMEAPPVLVVSRS